MLCLFVDIIISHTPKNVKCFWYYQVPLFDKSALFPKYTAVFQYLIKAK